VSWPLVSLDDISVHIRNGASIKQSSDMAGLPITRIETIANREVNLDKCGYADVGENDFLGHRLGSGDILISHINSVKHLGKCAIYEGARKDIVHGMNLLCLRPRQEIIFPRFLFHYLSSSVFLQMIPAITKKSVNQASFTVTAFKFLEISLPPLTEQKRIAAILDKADAIRRKRQQAIQLADDFLHAVFLDMFGDPNALDSQWPKAKIGVIGGNENNKRIPLKQADRDSRDGPYPYYGATGIIDYLDDYLFDGHYLLISEDGKNLINRTKPLAFPATGKFWVNNHSHVIADCGTINLTYFEFCLNLRDIRNYVTGIDQFKLNRASLDSIEISMPPLISQNKFSSIVQKARQTALLHSKALLECTALFDSTSQKAFSGEL
jgi:type I restriction enzyme S subunit